MLAPLTQYLIDNVGWRDSWLILSALGTMVTILVAVLIIRRQPQDMGLRPDGDEETASGVLENGIRKRQWSALGRGKRRCGPRPFWRLALVDGLRMGSMSTLGLFRIPYYIEQGVSAQVVGFALSSDAFSRR